MFFCEGWSHNRRRGRVDHHQLAPRLPRAPRRPRRLLVAPRELGRCDARAHRAHAARRVRSLRCVACCRSAHGVFVYICIFVSPLLLLTLSPLFASSADTHTHTHTGSRSSTRGARVRRYRNSVTSLRNCGATRLRSTARARVAKRRRGCSSAREPARSTTRTLR